MSEILCSQQEFFLVPIGVLVYVFGTNTLRHKFFGMGSFLVRSFMCFFCTEFKRLYLLNEPQHLFSHDQFLNEQKVEPCGSKKPTGEIFYNWNVGSSEIYLMIKLLFYTESHYQIENAMQNGDLINQTKLFSQTHICKCRVKKCKLQISVFPVFRS